MRLADHQVTTDEVRRWRGVHLLHFQGSSCSQKVRILLAEKGIAWTSHPVNLARHENTRPWFLGINPRGVVPVLVHDGAVHVESNDLLEYIDQHLPSPAPSYLPRTDDERDQLRRSLALEDELHGALRTVTMGILVPRAAARKPPRTLEAFARGGAPDAQRDAQVAWWRAFARDGVTRDQLLAAYRAFAAAFGALDAQLRQRPWLIGDRISLLEIAWFISIHRLVLAGYPLARHPRVQAHYAALLERPAFAAEVGSSGAVGAVLRGYALYRRLSGTTLAALAAEGA